jgi:hypothetical protein
MKGPSKVKIAKVDKELVNTAEKALSEGDYSSGSSTKASSTVDIVENAFVINKPDLTKVNEKLVGAILP